MDDQKIIDTLTPHLGHDVMVSSYLRVITPQSILPEKATWNYGGFAVECITCWTNLSQQWN